MSIIEKEPSQNSLYELIREARTHLGEVQGYSEAIEVLGSGSGGSTVIEQMVLKLPQVTTAILPHVRDGLNTALSELSETTFQLAEIITDPTHQHHSELVTLIKDTIGYRSNNQHQRNIDSLIKRRPETFTEEELESIQLFLPWIQLPEDKKRLFGSHLRTYYPDDNSPQ